MHCPAVALWAGLAVAGLAGCRSADAPAGAGESLFAPATMRIHPIFTQVADLDDAGQPDGIEAQLEFDDRFGDPAKAAGRAMFEVYDYQRQPPFTGQRVGGPYVAAIATPAEQRDKWNKTLRTYRFPLAFPAVAATRDYVLTVVFERTGGGRFFDKRVIVGRKGPGRPSISPAVSPAISPAISTDAAKALGS